ncbi:branched-chain amino acid aminotransferase II [Aspergillus steynii IBT 23096]|uniref:Branched-chain-amino-acid aminotransferase n=1 Tax=Aspergillus steynii IBT 23096 TaxID=1392250 RepID=A0A2I2GII4_9EURO|nr:branched-chain amino acid aminotransferase II [Aspergillus steynii IBT 23096]PLB52679.1 branched-chain amino acid aminotransferase II [Aspergillus steynii IBT 23096]
MSTTPTASQGASRLDATKLNYSYTTTPRDVPSEATIRGSDETICTDHMIVASWTSKEGWSAPELKPYGPFSLFPTASCLHYAHECFEGLKAYRGYDGKVRLFRPDRNARRLQMSAERVALPPVDADALEKPMMAVLSVDASKWLPRDRAGEFLYVRPTIIGTNSQLGIQPPSRAILYIIVGYMSRMDMPPGGKRLLTSPEDTVRSWVGGFGYAKVGANYGPSVNATREAYARGFHQILWLYGSQGECTEAGGSNFFVVWKRKDGRKELVTAPLDDRLILDGVTRRSCLDLARERLGDQLEVTERKFTIDELFEAAAENRILESFAAGTAWFICPISLIHHRDQEIAIPMGPDDTPGEITGKIKNWLGDIMYGRTEHEWGVVVPEKN